MKEKILELYTVNDQPINHVIAGYVERKDVAGLADFFNATLEDLYLIIEK